MCCHEGRSNDLASALLSQEAHLVCQMFSTIASVPASDTQRSQEPGLNARMAAASRPKRDLIILGTVNAIGHTT